MQQTPQTAFDTPLCKLLRRDMQGMAVCDVDCYKDTTRQVLGLLSELMEASDDVIRLVARHARECLGAIGGLISTFTSLCAGAEGRDPLPSEADTWLLEAFIDLATRLVSDADQMP